MMKITSSTSITSTSGVTLISAIGCDADWLRSNPPNDIRAAPENARRS
jgi:hypothetical protein